MRALSLSNLRHVKSAVIGHPKRNSTPKKTASTLRNVPKTATKCKLEGQSRTLSRRGDCGRKMRERAGKRAFLQGSVGGVASAQNLIEPSRFGTMPLFGVAARLA
jgi:hypothetical protein